MTEANPETVVPALTCQDELLIRIADVPACPACDSPGLLLVRFRNSWKNQSGDDVHGIREILLCPLCSRGNNTAAELVSYLEADEKTDEKTALEEVEELEEIGGVIAAWVESLRQEHVDEGLLAAEYDQWLRGTL
ncbi:DUF6300 family protein [Streptomyces seoulensis]